MPDIISAVGNDWLACNVDAGTIMNRDNHDMMRLLYILYHAYYIAIGIPFRSLLTVADLSPIIQKQHLRKIAKDDSQRLQIGVPCLALVQCESATSSSNIIKVTLLPSYKPPWESHLYLFFSIAPSTKPRFGSCTVLTCILAQDAECQGQLSFVGPLVSNKNQVAMLRSTVW